MKVVGFGDNVVDCYADRRLMFPGGNALNVAVHASRAGADAAYIGAVGDDPAGRHIQTALRAEGVDISRLRVLAGRTAFCVIGHDNGEREFLRADLGVSIIAPDSGDLDMIARADAVHTGRSSQVAKHLPDFAARTRLSFDFALVHDPARIAEIAPHCYLASFSGGDLSDTGIAALHGFAREAGAQWCLITRGDKGAMLAGPDGVESIASTPVRIVDTLGAGDSFISRALVGLLRGESPGMLLHEAANAAAHTIGQIGGFGHPAPLDVDESDARPVGQIYAILDGVSE